VSSKLNLSATLSSLADENRIKILQFLRGEERCVCEIWEKLKLPQNLVSHHLKVLKEAKLIKCKKEGLYCFYSLEEKNIEALLSKLEKLLLTTKKGKP